MKDNVVYVDFSKRHKNKKSMEPLYIRIINSVKSFFHLNKKSHKENVINYRKNIS